MTFQPKIALSFALYALSLKPKFAFKITEHGTYEKAKSDKG